jgi:hypothetical protein
MAGVVGVGVARVVSGRGHDDWRRSRFYDHNERDSAMSGTASPTSSAVQLDPDTILDGLISIGLRLYDTELYDGEGPPEGSLAESERRVFAALFAPNLRKLTDEGREYARGRMAGWGEAFDRMVADVERRDTQCLLGMTFGEARAEVEGGS